MHERAFLPVFLSAAILLSGCTSTTYFAGKKSEVKRFDGGAVPVYVTNPEMAPEYRILQLSGIYNLSSNPESARRITLHKMTRLPACGNPMIASAFTLGIVPVVLPNPWYFGYEVEESGGVELVQHHLSLRERFSIWEWLLKWKSEKRAYAQAVAASVPTPRPNELLHSTPR
jgi:hypothetical protein